MAWVAVLPRCSKVSDLVAAAADERGYPVALSPLGYSGGVNDSVWVTVVSRGVALATIMVIDVYGSPVADERVRYYNRWASEFECTKIASGKSSVGELAPPRLEPFTVGLVLVGACVVLMLEVVDPVSISLFVGNVSYSILCTGASGTGRWCGMVVE